MTSESISKKVKKTNKSRRGSDELGYILYHCWDLPILQTSKLIRLPTIQKSTEEEKQPLAQAKALRKKLIAYSEQITQRPRYPIQSIVDVIERNRISPGSHDLSKIKKSIGIPFPRNRLDLARYYAIRLIMEGIDQYTIAEFLEVDLRTIGNYISQAKERIRMILETDSIINTPKIWC
jgi:hypothetical protein